MSPFLQNALSDQEICFHHPQPYLPPMCNSRNRIDVSPCIHWSPPSTHTALQLIQRASAFYWPSNIYSLPISIKNFSSPFFVFTPPHSCIFPPPTFQLPSAQSERGDQNAAGRKNTTWRGVNAKSGVETFVIELWIEKMRVRQMKADALCNNCKCHVGGGRWPTMTRKYVNSYSPVANPSQVHPYWWY